MRHSFGQTKVRSNKKTRLLRSVEFFLEKLKCRKFGYSHLLIETAEVTDDARNTSYALLPLGSDIKRR
jgi:hypothetical protein